MTLLNKLIDNLNFKVNWVEVMKMPEFLKLEGGGYHADWHTEGNSLNHTVLTVNEVYKLPEWNNLNSFEKLCLVGAALFHDIGKGVCNKLDEDGINYSAPYHSVVGEKITRYLLWDEPYKVREMICSLIKYHMKPKHFIDKDDSLIEKIIIEISHNSNCKLLYLLDKCDRTGALGPYRELEIQKCEDLKLKSILLDCFDNPYKFFSDQVKFNYFKDNTNTYEKTNQYSHNFDFTVYLMCGVAGSGKSTYSSKFLKEYPIISRDLVRIQLGYIEKDGKLKGDKNQEDAVSRIINEQVKEMCRNCQSFVYDNLNIRKKYRDEFINSIKVFKKYNAKIVIVYVETSKENNIIRRNGQIQSSQIDKMQREMDFPYSHEAHELIVYRNY